jgi:hypothetical protein
MRLTGIKVGDIARVDQQHCHVIAVEKGRLHVRPIGRSAYRWAKACQVEAHWARRK